jgi:transposase, IS30 family
MAYCQLTQEERYAIAACHATGMSLRQIGRKLNRCTATISREYRRNATRHDGAYRAEKAHSYAVARRRRSRRGSQFSPAHLSQVDALLRQKWSPQQISGWCRRKRQMSISHETIYRRIRRDKTAGGSLWRHLRIMSKFGRKRYRSQDSRGVQPGKRHISERPKVVEPRRQLGHWEGDTVIGQDKRHCVLTLVERKSGYVVIKKMSTRTKEQANTALSRAPIGLNRQVKTITLDNGTEFHGYGEIEKLFRVKFYFATPYHSWERGTNENTNGLIRQYLPKGTSMKELTQRDCDTIASELNARPRKRLGYKTPAELLRPS